MSLHFVVEGGARGFVFEGDAFDWEDKFVRHLGYHSGLGGYWHDIGGSESSTPRRRGRVLLELV